MMPPCDYPEAERIERALGKEETDWGVALVLAAMFLLGFGAGLLFGAIW